MPTPILIMSDAPDSGTGLGRITKDLASLLSTMTEFRVGTFGKGGHGSRKLPWVQYTFGGEYQWGEELLPSVWKDFAGDTEGIIFTIWDASRLFWFGAPEFLPNTEPIREFLCSGQFESWGYFPVDGSGVDGRLSALSAETLKGYDRLLAYTPFGKEVLEHTVHKYSDFIPHGIDHETFQPRGPERGLDILGFTGQHKIVGCVMTNQARKDWGTWAQTAQELLTYNNNNYRFWVHTDLLERYWSIPALIEDFGLEPYVKVTRSPCTDVDLSYLYSACDITFLPSLGEGFGYPLVESMACGVPAIHHDYAGGGAHLPYAWKVETDMQQSRLDTLHNIYRPHLDYREFAKLIHHTLKHDTHTTEEIRGLVDHLFWPNLAPVWKKWFRDGLNAQ